MTVRARIVGAVAGLALSGAAFAHAMLDRSEPAVGSSVRTAPARIDLWFSEPLEATFSRLQVVDARGRRVDGGDPRLDNGTRLSISVRALPPGRYRVVWRAVSVDSHATEGDFTFDVAP